MVIDLLTAEEGWLAGDGGTIQFDIALLAERVASATEWLMRHPSTGGLRIGYFGRGTATAAALMAAAEHPERVSAIVAHGGRPDLADEALQRVRAPTLFIVAGDDSVSIRLNEFALGALRCGKRLQIMSCPQCRFEHPAIVEWAAEVARDWLVRYLPPTAVLGAITESSAHAGRGLPAPNPRASSESGAAASGSTRTGGGTGAAVPR
jgi:pimeloyl-ACP methyl ester carboxylesterase